MTIKELARLGRSRRDIARTLGVAESTVRYHLWRQQSGAEDGRCNKPQKAGALSEAIDWYLEDLEEGPVNLAALHDWLVSEHGYTGSLRSVQRYYARHYPRPKQRARRRVETPPGAQAQVDWAEWPQVWIAGRCVAASQFHMRLSYSRYGATVWSPRKDQLAWHHVHNEGFRRLGGVPATARVDNVKTAVAHGAGPWGVLNASYRSYAKAVRFHIDLCLPRHPEGKGKVERGILTSRRWVEVTRRHGEGWEELQAWSDRSEQAESERRVCPATGTSVLEAWEQEKRHLQPLPILPEPFDVVVTRAVAKDCTVAFEGRRYSVPFGLLGQRVELRGCARVVQVWAEGTIAAEHPRYGRERIVIDPAHYEGPDTETVAAPMPLGRMGRRLQQIAQMKPEQRPMDLYAALAEVAR